MHQDHRSNSIDALFENIGLDFHSEVMKRHAQGLTMRQTALQIGCAQATLTEWSRKHGITWANQQRQDYLKQRIWFAGVLARPSEHCRLWGLSVGNMCVTRHRYQLESADAIERLIRRDPAKCARLQWIRRHHDKLLADNHHHTAESLEPIFRSLISSQ